jgi:nucleotide-binding universal stress UspA family protein
VKVLFATDGSNEATIALQTANRLLRPAEREFDVVCVAPRLHKRRSAVQSYERLALREITQILETSKSVLASEGTIINLLSEIGSPSGWIVSRAQEYDLTVIGAKGRGTSGDVGLGPVASRVMEHALAPVLIGRKLQSEEGQRVLVAVDGSSAAYHVLGVLSSLFDINTAEICLMHVAETPWTEFGLEEEWVTYSDEDKALSEAGILEHEFAREGEAILERARDLLRPHHSSITTRIDEGNPAIEILSEAERSQYDLVVVGATGGRDLKHQMLGSVSSKIAWNAPCSVLIARELV